MEKTIIIYTDGGARGNGNKDCVSAWAYIMSFGSKTKEYKQACIGATNNQMELTAIIEALKAIKNKKDFTIKIHSDSAYCVNGMNNWIEGWKKKGWKNSKKEPVENKELWIELDFLAAQCTNIEFIKVKGHADNELNIRVDALVNEAMDEFIANQNNPESISKVTDIEGLMKEGLPDIDKQFINKYVQDMTRYLTQVESKELKDCISKFIEEMQNLQK